MSADQIEPCVIKWNRCVTHDAEVTVDRDTKRCPLRGGWRRRGERRTHQVEQPYAVWEDREGTTHDIATIEPRYAANIITYLDRRAYAVLRATAWHAAMTLPSDDQVGEMAMDCLISSAVALWDKADAARRDPQVAIKWQREERAHQFAALTARAAA